MSRPFVSVINLGCRVNRVESDRISASLVEAGLALVDPDDADLIVINTCAVTGEAEAKTRKAVRHALGRARAPYVVCTGCAANLHPGMLEELSERVVVEPRKVDVAARAAELLGCSGAICELDPRGKAELLGRSRWGVKIQDGCDNRCTYCIVWKARGPERSVPADLVIDRVREAVEAGIPEVVLTGVNLGAYDGESACDSHVELDELIRRILNETEVGQLRLSSIEPMDVDERLLGVMAAGPERIAPFLHLPVQSGSTSVLERMGRPYMAGEFLSLVGRIRSNVPAASISADIIVGFPGETDDEFAETLEVARAAAFSRIHVFRYSARPGTVAASMPDQVDPEVSHERSRALRALADELSRADAIGRVGTFEQAVIEQGAMATLGSFHKAVIEDAPPFVEPRLVRVGIIGVDEKGLLHGRIGTLGAPERDGRRHG